MRSPSTSDSSALPRRQLWQGSRWDTHTRCRHRADLAYGIAASREEKALTFAALKTKPGFILIHGAENLASRSCSTGRSPGAGLRLCSPPAFSRTFLPLRALCSQAAVEPHQGGHTGKPGFPRSSRNAAPALGFPHRLPRGAGSQLRQQPPLLPPATSCLPRLPSPPAPSSRPSTICSRKRNKEHRKPGRVNGNSF